MDLTLKIDTVQNISPALFYRDYFKPQKPVVIKGIADKTEAGKNWSINYFRETMGNFNVDLYDDRNLNSSASAFTRPDLKMQFSKYLDLISKSEHTDFRIFLFNMFRLRPELKKEFPCPELFKGLLDGMAHMFFGGKEATVRIHYDIDMSNVLHTHFGGRKRVVLVAPEFNAHLYCLPFNTYSLIDPDKPDYKQHPALLLVKGYDLVLEPGDSLFMPSGYWHYMTYLEAGFSVSYRKLAHSPVAKAEGLYNLGIAMPLDKLANKLAGKKWLEAKKRMARKRAYRAIEREYRRMQPALFVEKQPITFV